MNNEEQEFNLLLFTVEAIVSNQKTYTTVNKIYEENNYKAYKLARENEYYDHPIFTSGSILRNILCKRILGILLLEEIEQHIEIIKKGWSNLYNYVLKTKNQNIVLSDIINNNANTNMTDDEFNAIITITLLISNILNKSVEQDELLMQYIQVQTERLKFYNSNSTNFAQFNYNNLSEKEKNKAKSIYSRICNKYHSIETINDINNFRYIEEIKVYFDSIYMITNAENLEFNDSMIIFEQKDIIEILTLYYMVNQNQNTVEATKYLIQGLIFKYFLKDYNNIKDYYFKNNKETMFYKIEDKNIEINNLEDENKKLNNIINQQNIEIEFLKKRISMIEKDLLKEFSKEKKQYKEDIKKAKQENKILKFNNEELYKLRELIFKPKLEKEYKNKLNTDINNFNIILVGGHENLQNQVKKAFPNIQCLDGFNSKINIGRKPDLIFFFWQYMNHSTYDVVISYCRKNKVKYDYVTANNIKLLENQIKNILQ